ncbi:MAG TPA: dihydrofolate reductase [Phycisphaerales bacterium]|nr:dihydrofolate reductase [Phycisphaerales bacterium]HCD33136.1 dihydrofolate reductase [Phycisphaerales bacterium]|tara:strand:- start:2179 stop:2673 length:495 start_codon:yes stop_codon:yes gene_type:complete
MRLAMILAKSENDCLGKDNDMPWHLPAELKRFMKITTGHSMIMGRKTYETFAKPLPNRRHIVITRQADYQAPEGVEVVHSLDDAIALCQNEEQVFVIGGAEIYRQAYDKCDLLYLTIVHASFEGDTYLNCIDLTQWDKIEEESFNADDKNPLDYTCYLYHRKST